MFIVHELYPGFTVACLCKMVRALNQVTAPSGAIPSAVTSQTDGLRLLLWRSLQQRGVCCGLSYCHYCRKVHFPKHHTEVTFQGELITPLLSAGEAASVLCCPACATLLHPCPDQEGGGEMTEESWQGNKNGQGLGARN